VGGRSTVLGRNDQTSECTTELPLVDVGIDLVLPYKGDVPDISD
jgi:hypothetical protein